MLPSEGTKHCTKKEGCHRTHLQPGSHPFPMSHFVAKKQLFHLASDLTKSPWYGTRMTAAKNDAQHLGHYCPLFHPQSRQNKEREMTRCARKMRETVKQRMILGFLALKSTLTAQSHSLFPFCPAQCWNQVENCCRFPAESLGTAAVLLKVNGSVNVGQTASQHGMCASPVCQVTGAVRFSRWWSLCCIPSCRALVRFLVAKARALTERVSFLRFPKWSCCLLFWELHFTFGPGMSIQTVIQE